jgi:hypothetical protein
MYMAGTVEAYLRWLLFGMLERCGVRMWEQRKTSMQDHDVAAELGLHNQIDTETKSLSLTKEQVDTMRRRRVRVAAQREADTP